MTKRVTSKDLRTHKARNATERDTQGAKNWSIRVRTERTKQATQKKEAKAEAERAKP